MIRIAIAAALASFVVYDAAVAPASTGPNETIEQPRGVKGDRLPVLPAGTNCADAAWPYYRGDCVRGRQPSDQGPAARVVRIVAADRTPPGDISPSFAN
ncbi:hypothetical protein [Rhodoplanes sp. Z2-YC6860]|uniref:hypothetical protein n=1 Tax=Rhodoplanes sp. Z2-YC6860 TaxID=674703 RepID=UPI00082F9915|nr:hypothetical protein [Rhodoplanes sp. Z2-YC6860]